MQRILAFMVIMSAALIALGADKQQAVPVDEIALIDSMSFSGEGPKKAELPDFEDFDDLEFFAIDTEMLTDIELEILNEIMPTK